MPTEVVYDIPVEHWDLFSNILTVFENNASRCCDDEDDRTALALALTKALRKEDDTKT